MNDEKNELTEQEPEVIEGGDSPPDSKTTITSKTVIYSAPIPDPVSLKEYEEIQPGSADRIFTMAENAQAMNAENSRRRLDIDEKRLNYTAFLSGAMIVVALVAMYLERDLVAVSGFGISAICMIVRVFLVGIRKNGD